jgi:hypothetical protein
MRIRNFSIPTALTIALAFLSAAVHLSKSGGKAQRPDGTFEKA